MSYKSLQNNPVQYKGMQWDIGIHEKSTAYMHLVFWTRRRIKPGEAYILLNLNSDVVASACIGSRASRELSQVLKTSR